AGTQEQYRPLDPLGHRTSRSAVTDVARVQGRGVAACCRRTSRMSRNTPQTLTGGVSSRLAGFRPQAMSLSGEPEGWVRLPRRLRFPTPLPLNPDLVPLVPQPPGGPLGVVPVPVGPPHLPGEPGPDQDLVPIPVTVTITVPVARRVSIGDCGGRGDPGDGPGD